MDKIRTHAIRELDQKRIPYTLLVQAHRSKNVEQAVIERGVTAKDVVKTLVIRRPDRQHIIALVRGDRRLSLKKLARVVGVKKLEMAPESDVPRVTGYQIGAVAPFGLRRKDVPIYADKHILETPRVSISAGRHDAGLEMASEDLLRATGSVVEDITE
jgi:Cys-tRNA(Pro) deacylase